MISYQSIFQNLQLGILSIVTKFKNYFQRNIKKQKSGFTQSDIQGFTFLINGLVSIPFLIGFFIYFLSRNKFPHLSIFFLLLGGGLTYGLAWLFSR